MRKALFVMCVFLLSVPVYCIELSKLSMQQNNTWGGTQTFNNVTLTGTLTGTTVSITSMSITGTNPFVLTLMGTGLFNQGILTTTMTVTGATYQGGILTMGNYIGSPSNQGMFNITDLNSRYTWRSTNNPYIQGNGAVYFNGGTSIATVSTITVLGLTMNPGASVNASSMTVYNIFYCPQSATLPTSDVKAGGQYYETDTFKLWLATENVVGVQSWVCAAKPGD
jgi:hypothetical protein